MKNKKKRRTAVLQPLPSWLAELAATKAELVALKSELATVKAELAELKKKDTGRASGSSRPYERASNYDINEGQFVLRSEVDERDHFG